MVGGVSDAPPTDAPPQDAASGEPARDPLAQIGSRDGGMPGDAPADQAEDGTSTGRDSKAPAKGERNPTVQTKDSPGGETEPDPQGKDISAEAKKTPAEVIAARQATAREFYQRTGWSPKKIVQHMAEIDFTKPVTVTTLTKGTPVDQWVHPQYGIGSYCSKPGTSASELGRWQGDRLQTPLQTTQDVQALESTAAPNNNTWSEPGPPPVSHPTEGGGIQYFTLAAWLKRPYCRTEMISPTESTK